MRLSLHSEADHNGNTFPMWSSSSSSSSLGESSPEMLQRSFSGGQSDSPLDYDMVEVTLVTAVVAEMNRVTDVMISKWTTEKDSKQDGEDNVSTEKIQRTAELSECNDNSMSVYLDANGEDTWNSRRGRRPSSTTPYLDATEIPDDDEEEEALFLSLSFDVGVQNSVSLTNTTSQVMGGGCALENVAKVDCALDPSVDSKADLPLCPQSFPSPSPAPDPREAPSTLRSKSIQQQTSHTVRRAKTKADTGTLRSTRPVGCPGIKPSISQAKLPSPCKSPRQV